MFMRRQDHLSVSFFRKTLNTTGILDEHTNIEHNDEFIILIIIDLLFVVQD